MGSASKALSFPNEFLFFPINFPIDKFLFLFFCIGTVHMHDTLKDYIYMDVISKIS